jgi:Domain of unknown function (DUF4124)
MLHKTPDPQLKQPLLHKRLRLLPLCLAGLLGVSGQALAAASWQWLDESGRKVFSDMPPPATVPAKNVLKQPGAQRNTPALDHRTTDEALKTASPKAKAADPAEDKKKREADNAEEAKRKAQEDKNAALLADNCQRAKTSLATLQSGVRLMTSNAQGEPVVLDDTQREQESLRLRQIMADNCR